MQMLQMLAPFLDPTHRPGTVHVHDRLIAAVASSPVARSFFEYFGCCRSPFFGFFGCYKSYSDFFGFFACCTSYFFCFFASCR